MNLENILSIRTYQAVKFDGKLNTFFVSEVTAQHKPVELTIVPHVGVSVKNSRDHVIIPYPNIAGISMNTEHKDSKSSERKKDLSTPAKSQKLSRVKIDPVGAKKL